MNVDISGPVYFYNKNALGDTIYKLKVILYTDDEICFCVASPYIGSKSNLKNEDIKILFYINDGFVDSQIIDSMRATNDLHYARSYLFNE